ncbi:hypothetical protein [Enterobacter pseudoroggenkampii]|uniref:hypothetical protein n=1 Tax=Enterobacter pseudoroggenkampii TaxID=2996112 RepID=UPI002263E4E4|nr:hypothetical protein [Enterobacter pseudoroggenkampii]MCX8289088.1 hypothetical protein [Enterobacter pseudoroggenkampii]
MKLRTPEQVAKQKNSVGVSKATLYVRQKLIDLEKPEADITDFFTVFKPPEKRKR